jgi:hypothetical protein
MSPAGARPHQASGRSIEKGDEALVTVDPHLLAILQAVADLVNPGHDGQAVFPGPGR